MKPTEVLPQLMTAPPVTLALILGLAAVGVVALALFVLLRIAGREDR
jgi:hypothetical protein